ncbi:MAG: (2Fe-2S)-binding protein [Deltaproteobacteria bacterium]|nr:(2Fe-2S)-binding protein [Deltaproteobacteria bacterium]
MSVPIQLVIDGKQAAFEVGYAERLVDTLREKAGLLGVKRDCGRGECGACSVFLDGRLVSACLVPSIQADGSEIWTAEGLSREGRLADLQAAFSELDAVSCGHCTPGMLMAGEALLRQYRRPTTEQIRHGLAGNRCRCAGYDRYVAAIRKVARRRAARRTAEP